MCGVVTSLALMLRLVVWLKHCFGFLNYCVCACGAIVELWILQWNFVDCVNNDEWIGNRHVGIGWGREVLSGKKM